MKLISGLRCRDVSGQRVAGFAVAAGDVLVAEAPGREVRALQGHPFVHGAPRPTAIVLLRHEQVTA